MKRKALLIGNSDGLSGVTSDIQKFTKFLKSDLGGKWYDDEITVQMNPSKLLLATTISRMKSEKYDFSFVVFSGHGEFIKNTVLTINEKGESINELDLYNITKRQISIFDCCRAISRISDSLLEKSMRAFASESLHYDNIRQRYATRIMQAIEQQVRLYACAKGETALDTDEDVLSYTQNLLKAAVNISSSEEFKLIEKVHNEAKEETSNKAWQLKRHTQNPTADLPKCSISQQLIMSINPKYNQYRSW